METINLRVGGRNAIVKRKFTAVVAVTATVASGFSSSSAFAQAPIIRASDTPTARVDQAVPADQAAVFVDDPSISKWRGAFEARDL